MKIGLWSDCVNFPSLPAMKLSAYHKARGDTVSLLSAGEAYDRVYISKAFNLPAVKKIPQQPLLFYADDVVEGGTGFAITIESGRERFRRSKHASLPDEVEHIYPDYGLYGCKDTAYGFLTRGCCNACGFCLVSKKEGVVSKQVADLGEWWRGQETIKLLDPNILACENGEKLLWLLAETRAKLDITQGLDARFTTPSVVSVLNRARIKNIHFAFDLMRNEDQIVRGLKTFIKYYTKTLSAVKVYVLTNYDTTLAEDWYRVQKVRELGLAPYVMIYQKGTQPQFLTDLARWCNSLCLCKSTSFEEYAPRKDGRKCGDLYGNILRGEINETN